MWPFFRTGRPLVTTHKNKTARFWSAETGKDVGVMTPMERERVWHLTFTPDGKGMITTHYDHGIILWEVPSRKNLLALKPLDVNCLKPVFTRGVRARRITLLGLKRE
jgi:WD40 repeat protein